MSGGRARSTALCARAAGLLAGVLAVTSAPATACSLRNDALLPTNYELVRATPTIVLARTGDPVGRDEDGPRLRFTVVRVLRGTMPETSLAISGGGSPFRGASPEDDFATARPGAFVGSCIAFDYRPGRLYVLFLDGERGAWTVHGAAFSRVNEEVARVDSPWVTAVAAYVRIAALDDAAREDEALRTLAKTASPAVAQDIARHFATPTHEKSEAALLALYRGAPTDEVRRKALVALARHGGTETTAIFRAFLRDAKPPTWAEPWALDWAARQHATTELPFILRRFTVRPPGERWDALEALAVLAGPADADELGPTLAGLSPDEADQFYKQAAGLAGTPAAVADIDRRLGGAYDKSMELTLTLARWGDPAVVRWAAGAGQHVGKERWLASYVLARSPLPQAEAPLLGIAAGNDSVLLAGLIDALADTKREDRLELVAAIVARRPNDQRVTNAANRTLRKWSSAGLGGAEALLVTLPPEEAESN